jgi:sec-independent protein translocase protein TatB
MFGIGTQEILVILALAVIIVGPRRLPEVANTLGKTFGELKRAFDGIKESAVTDFRNDMKGTFDSVAKAASVGDLFPEGHGPTHVSEFPVAYPPEANAPAPVESEPAPGETGTATPGLAPAVEENAPGKPAAGAPAAETPAAPTRDELTPSYKPEEIES